MTDPTPSPSGPAADYAHHLRTMRTVRVVIALVALGVGALLILNGNVVAGALIGGFAVFRLGAMLYMSHQRQRFADQRRPRPTGGTAGPSTSTSGSAPLGRFGARRRGPRADFPRLTQRELTVAATTIGMNPDDLRRAVDQGQSIAQLAAARGVPAPKVVDAIVADASAMLDLAVGRGRVSAARQGQAKARLPQWADDMVNASAVPSR
jgi:hypothetical protein